MAVYGVSRYGNEFYGYDIPPAFRVDPFTATSVGYDRVLVSWTQPAGDITAYRLVKNRFGFPVDQDDGEVLVDTINYPGPQFVDTDIVPGTYQYYGFFVLLNNAGGNQGFTWVRSGWTACLAINNYNSGLQIHTLIPTFFHLQQGDIQLPLVNDFPAEILDFFCTVLGWGVDYLKTQYDTYLNVNDPWKISEKDLYNLATQLGININPDIHPYTLRKAVFFNAVVNQQRGTTSGINQELEALTGYAADLQIAPNFMLENDQSGFTDPAFPAWSPNINYLLNEFVTFNGFDYQCRTSTNNIGNPPTGANSTNTWWNPVVNVDNPAFLSNGKTGHLNTWEAMMLTSTTGQGTGMSERIGVTDPLGTSATTFNALSFQNTSGSTGTMLVRSISRVGGDITTNSPTFPPNKDQVIGDGIPVPFVFNTLYWDGTSWSPTVRYGTDSIVTFNNTPYIALRASTNVAPPNAARLTSNNEWAPVSPEPRLRIGISGYFQASTTGITVTPFCDWFDSNGNFITRVTARNTTAGSNTLPTGLVYDSFTFPTGTTINGRTSDDGSALWSGTVGQLSKSPFADGCVYPAVSTTRSYATVNSGVSNGQVGVTFVTNPSSTTVTGLIMRFQDDSNYLLATMTGIFLKQNGTYTSLGGYSSPANPGDRLIVTLNGSTITAFVNGTQVVQVSSAFNTTGTTHGLINDIISVTGPGGSVTVTNPGTQNSVVGTGV